MRIETIRTEGLGDSSYVVSHEGVAVVIDPQRDIDRFERALDETGALPRFVLETHIHNDYISGGLSLAAAVESELVLPSAAAPAFRHRPAFHNEEFDAGSFLIRPIHTPGHTPEHMAYLLIVDGEPVALFSGGSLLVGSAGRADLLGMERADTLARLQYRSVHRLADLPDQVVLYPTHGAGSFCTASGTGELTSTIGAERTTNPVLGFADEDSFVKGQLDGLVPYPTYYRYMGPVNLMGPPPAPALDTPPIGRDALESMEDRVEIVDMRPKASFAAGHIPDSIGIPLRHDFGIWTGWVITHGSPLVLVADPGQDIEEARRQLLRIGFDDVRGVIWDLEPWGGELRSYQTTNAQGLARSVENGAQVLDARAPNEWEAGIIEDSILQYAPEVANEPHEDLDSGRKVYVACGTGHRATMVASFLEKKQFDPVVLVDSGVMEVLRELSKGQRYE